MSRSEFNRAFVVSDLHLGGADGFQMFSAGKQFESLCKLIAKETKGANPTLLLVNGDFVDFLAEPQAGYWNGETAAFRLKKIAGRTAFKPVFDGLSRFVAKNGAHLTVVLGNHDLELALPGVKETFLELIGAESSSRRSRVEFAFDGNGYRFQVGKASALATHGNEVDEFNFTRFDILQQIINELQLEGVSPTAEEWKPSAGTAFVIDAINKMKRDYPFVDLLKPESVTGIALVVLSPKNLKMADEFAALVATGKRNEAVRPESERRFLTFDSTALSLPRGRSAALELKANEYVRNPNLDAKDLIYGSVEGMLGLTDWVESARSAVRDLFDKGIRTVSGAASQASLTIHSETMRQSLRRFVDENVLEVRSLGDADRELLKMVRQPYDVVFAGHTHARRFCVAQNTSRNPQPLMLVNTGTWAGLMRLSEADVASRDRFVPFYDLLRTPSRSALMNSRWYAGECPVAVLEKDGRRSILSLQRIDETGALEAKDLAGKSYRHSIA